MLSLNSRHVVVAVALVQTRELLPDYSCIKWVGWMYLPARKERIWQWSCSSSSSWLSGKFCALNQRQLLYFICFYCYSICIVSSCLERERVRDCLLTRPISIWDAWSVLLTFFFIWCIHTELRSKLLNKWRSIFFQKGGSVTSTHTYSIRRAGRTFHTSRGSKFIDHCLWYS